MLLSRRFSPSFHPAAASNRVRRGCFITFLLVIAPLAFGQQAEISGTVVDASGAAVRSVEVRLSLGGSATDRTMQSAESGDFAFSDVTPGPYLVAFSAKGFAPKTVTAEVHAGETLRLPHTTLSIESLATGVTVTQTQEELAGAQIKTQEQQRLLGLVPNFFASYDHDAAPLNAKQKIELTARTWFDPSSFVIAGIIAGVGQARNTHEGFGQGAQGYAKRYGAGFANVGTRLLLERVITTSLFKQDPRYFYKGTGTKTSRALYAISRTLVCRGDNKKDQFCYSSLIGRFGIGFITNYYYPAADRDSAGVILKDSAIGIGFEAVGKLFQEFVAHKITRRKH